VGSEGRIVKWKRHRKHSAPITPVAFAISLSSEFTIAGESQSTPVSDQFEGRKAMWSLSRRRSATPVNISLALLLSSLVAAAIQSYDRLSLGHLNSPEDILGLIVGLTLSVAALRASRMSMPGQHSRRILNGTAGLIAGLSIGDYLFDSAMLDALFALVWFVVGFLLLVQFALTGHAKHYFFAAVLVSIAELARTVSIVALHGNGPGSPISLWYETGSQLLIRMLLLIGVAEILRKEESPPKRQHPARSSNERLPPQGGRIAISMYRLSGGGAQRRSLALANALAARGYKIDLVVLSDKTRYRHLLLPTIRFVALDTEQRGALHNRLHHYLPYRWIRVCLGSVALARYVREESPAILMSAADWVLFTTVFAWHLAGKRGALILRATNFPSANLKIPKLFQNALELGLGMMLRIAYSPATFVIAVSDGVADEIHRLSGIDRTRIVTIYEPVVEPSISEKCDAPLAHAWLEPGQPPVILAVGRLHIQKDYPTLIKAFAMVRSVRSARLVIIGEGRLRRRLQGLIDSLNLGDDAVLAGSTENPFAWMSRASLFVLSSAWEGLGSVLIEALACGCPVVSTNCPSGPSEILQGGDFGTLVACRNPISMANAILSSLEQRPDQEALRNRAQAFSVSSAVDSYSELFALCSKELPALPYLSACRHNSPATSGHLKPMPADCQAKAAGPDRSRTGSASA
jgi:glycosyltransferase involved in cell wall biosynthesis